QSSGRVAALRKLPDASRPVSAGGIARGFIALGPEQTSPRALASAYWCRSDERASHGEQRWS
ncbi:MAG: hypothetical protein J7449_10855, partial [Thermomicrobium sp.]|uniref:hypothetical protein n=1 Tax=Thermomicrobium sp. TaxID=1969469 RepID=UPI001B2E0472